MNCKNCGALVTTEVREGVFVCDYCHTENRVEKPKEVIEIKPEVQEPLPKEKAIDFESLAQSIVRIQSKNGSATGFFIHEEGWVLTNAHVVEGEPIVQGFIGNSPVINEFEVKANGSIIGVDLALIELLDQQSFEIISMSDKPVKIGETVYAIGNPKNLGMSVSKGTVSRLKEKEFQLDMTLNPGNSGGPVINEDGKLVGIISYLLEEVNGLSFAVDLTSIQSFLDQAKKDDLNPEEKGIQIDENDLVEPYLKTEPATSIYDTDDKEIKSSPDQETLAEDDRDEKPFDWDQVEDDEDETIEEENELSIDDFTFEDEEPNESLEDEANEVFNELNVEGEDRDV